MALCTPKVSSMLKNTDDKMEFSIDMEDPVCKGSKDDNHQQEQHSHGIRDVFFGHLKIFT